MKSRDLIKQYVLDLTSTIYPEPSQHWLARAWRAFQRRWL